MTSELAFRAQLVFREQRQIYDYWQTCAGLRGMPSRGDIDPVSMRPHLPYISLIDISDGMQTAIVRLAGTRLRDVYGFELTGKYLGDLEWGDKREYWHAVYSRILSHAAPQQGAVRGPISQREYVTLFWLRLPLSDDGKTVNKILSYDVAVPSLPAQSADVINTQPGLAANG